MELSKVGKKKLGKKKKKEKKEELNMIQNSIILQPLHLKQKALHISATVVSAF